LIVAPRGSRDSLKMLEPPKGTSAGKRTDAWSSPSRSEITHNVRAGDRDRSRGVPGQECGGRGVHAEKKRRKNPAPCQNAHPNYFRSSRKRTEAVAETSPEACLTGHENLEKAKRKKVGTKKFQTSKQRQRVSRTSSGVRVH